MGPYLVGVDIGGTFTDCVVLDRDGQHHRDQGRLDAGQLRRGHARRDAGRGRTARAALRRLLRADLGPHPRHDRRHQRADPAQGREGRTDHDQGSRGRDPHHARLARRDFARHRQGRALPREPEARSDRAQAPDPRRLRARRLLRRDRRPAQRGGGRARDPRARSPTAATRSRSASCGRSAMPRTSGASREMVRAIAPGVFVSCSIDIAPEVGRVRAHDRDGAERLHRPGDVALSLQPRPRS